MPNPFVQMAWVFLLLAGVTEICWAVGLKYTENWTRLWPSLITGALMFASFSFLSRAILNLPLGTAYAVWTGIGAAGTALVGMAWFGEPRDAARLACIALIVVAVVGLKLFSKSP